MFCPICRDEFVEGISRCPDCEVELVETLPPHPELVPVYESINYLDLGLAKSVLEGVGIPAMIRGGDLLRLTEAVITGKVFVPEEHAEAAREALLPLKMGALGEEGSSPQREDDTDGG